MDNSKAAEDIFPPNTKRMGLAEAIKFYLKENLKIEVANGYTQRTIRVVLWLEDEELSSDQVTLPDDSKGDDY